MSPISMDALRYQYRPARLEDLLAVHQRLHAIAAQAPNNDAPTLEAGMNYAGLGVDGDSPTGAFNLYQNLGFAIYLRSVVFHKERHD